MDQHIARKNIDNIGADDHFDDFFRDVLAWTKFEMPIDIQELKKLREIKIAY